MLQAAQSQFDAGRAQDSFARPPVNPSKIWTFALPELDMMRQLLVLSRGRPNRQAAHLEWCAGPHLANMMAVPGISDGAVHRLFHADAASQWQIASLYGLHAPVGDILAEIFERAESEAMPLSDAFDDRSVLMLEATPISPRRLAKVGADRCDGLLYIVLSNAAPGEDDDFNIWYDTRHINDVLAIPGFIAAQRFRIAPDTAGRSSPWRYLAIYEVAPERADSAIAELGARAGGDAMPISPAFDASTAYARLFELERQAQA